MRCEFVGNNKQWSRGQPGYWRAQVGPYGYLTPAFYYNPSSSTTTTSVFVFTLLLTYNGSTTRRDLEPFLLEPAVVLQELLIISQL